MLQFVVVDDNDDDYGEIILKIATDTIRCVEDNNCLRLGECQLLNRYHIRHIWFDDFSRFARKFYFSRGPSNSNNKKSLVFVKTRMQTRTLRSRPMIKIYLWLLDLLFILLGFQIYCNL